MTHWKELTDARYVSSADVDKDTDCLISSAKGGTGEGENGRKFRKPELRFVDANGAPMFPDADGKGRPFFPSNTDCKTLTSLAGSPHVERWAGLVITLYQTTTTLKKQTVPCIRIRPTLVADHRAKDPPKPSGQQAGRPVAPTASRPSAPQATQPTTPAREPGSEG